MGVPEPIQLRLRCKIQFDHTSQPDRRAPQQRRRPTGRRRPGRHSVAHGNGGGGRQRRRRPQDVLAAEAGERRQEVRPGPHALQQVVMMI